MDQAMVLMENLQWQSMVMQSQGEVEIDHRLLPRNKRTKYDHERALYCIMSDYLSSISRFDGREFQQMFRLSRSRFQRLMEDVAKTNDPFFLSGADGAGVSGASFQAKLLLPLKSMAYGVPSHCFRDYFQMSESLAGKCYRKFCKIVIKIYQFEYLRMPTAEDLKNISRLHKAVHGVEGMFGSLDCMHTWWKNCPVAWKGSYKGKEKRSTIVLEGACDHHLWLWHAAYGYAGTLNDINILNMSPLMDRILDGTMAELEKEVVPFTIASEQFNQLFLLVDGIYPKLSRFVKAISQPIGKGPQGFTKWQESARKDIERAFGVLQFRWQCVSRPIHLMKLEYVSDMVTAAIIFHNMGVSDRVMGGDVRARYNPANSLDQDETDVIVSDRPRDNERRQKTPTHKTDSRIHVSGDPDVYKLITKKNRWTHPTDERSIHLHEILHDKDEYARLQHALVNHHK